MANTQTIGELTIIFLLITFNAFGLSAARGRRRRRRRLVCPFNSIQTNSIQSNQVGNYYYYHHSLGFLLPNLRGFIQRQLNFSVSLAGSFQRRRGGRRHQVSVATQFSSMVWLGVGVVVVVVVSRSSQVAS